MNEFATDLDDLQMLPEESGPTEALECTWTCSWTTIETL